MKLTRLNFEVRVPENDLSDFYEEAKAAGIEDPSVRLSRAVTEAVKAVIKDIALLKLQDKVNI